MNLVQSHLERLKDRLANLYGLDNLVKWIEEKTWLDNKRFSYKGHEFQRNLIADAAQTSIVVKCAQVGISEIIARWALAAACTQDDFTIIYTFPTTSDAEKFCKTRIDPCIYASTELAQAVNVNLNNSEVKQFNRNSFIYFRGTLSETAALSVPANAVVHDEVDKSNLTQMSVYVSRLQHKPHKLRKLFSTPTVTKYGISREAETARRFRQVMTCKHCNHTFLPDYYANVHIPDYDRDKREITKSNLKDIRWAEAKLLCPSCYLAPGDKTEWVCENPEDNYPANAWFITPFSAPEVISAPYLVKNSTEYEKRSEFDNQALGLTAEDENDSLTNRDIENCLVSADLADTSTHLLGADMGLLCHVSVGRVAADGELLVVHREVIPYTRFEERRRELCARYRITISLHDAQPYVDLVNRICNADPNAWASVFTTGTPSTMYTVKEQELDPQEGKLAMRRLNVTRTMAFDSLLSDLKNGRIKVARDDRLDETWRTHMRSLKRVSKFDKTKEIVYVWEKTDGQDHFHFSLLYLSLAAKMRGLVSGYRPVQSVPILRSFKATAL